MKYTYSGNRAKIDISLAVSEMELEANYVLERLNLEIERLIQSGYTKTQAVKMVLDDIVKSEGAFKSFVNRQKLIISELEKNLIASPVEEYAKENKGALLEWVLGAVKTSHCPDCIRMSNLKPQTIEQWRSHGVGLPREGLTECSYGCRCMLRVAEE